LDDVASQIESRHATTAHNEVVLVGPPNAGKSSLFNALVERYATTRRVTSAIVSPTSGTTRDYLTATISVGNMRVDLVDTAGMEENLTAPSTTIDAMAQSLTSERSKRAFIRAFCVDVLELEGSFVPHTCDLVVITKCDLTSVRVDRHKSPLHVPVVMTSSHTGDGLPEFYNEICRLLAVRTEPCRDTVVAITAQRCHESVRAAEIALNTATDLVQSDAGDEVVAAEVRVALAELGKVVGAIYTDDLLDRIFKTFCIGK
jgi:tRNA modification GTPase